MPRMNPERFVVELGGPVLWHLLYGTVNHEP